VVALPESPDALANATWPEVEALYKSVLEQPIASGDGDHWLSTWSRLEELVEEAGTRAMIAYTCDTADPDKEQANLRWSAEIFPKAAELQVQLAKRLLSLGYSRPDLETVLRGMRTDIEIFREENVPLFTQLEELVSEYQKITGGLSVDWEGERKTVPQLQPFLKSRDRAVRERAFRKQADAYLEQKESLSALFDRMYVLRDQVARNSASAITWTTRSLPNIASTTRLTIAAPSIAPSKKRSHLRLRG
jgi:oligoendopeptidase F